MKRANNLSIKALCLICASGLLAACGAGPYAEQQAQCLHVVTSHTAFAELDETTARVKTEQLQISLAFQVDSAFGRKTSSAECIYNLSTNASLSQPNSIRIGRTVHTHPQSIADLLSGRYLNPAELPNHQH